MVSSFLGPAFTRRRMLPLLLLPPPSYAQLSFFVRQASLTNLGNTNQRTALGIQRNEKQSALLCHSWMNAFQRIPAVTGHVTTMAMKTTASTPALNLHLSTPPAEAMRNLQAALTAQLVADELGRNSKHANDGASFMLSLKLTTFRAPTTAPALSPITGRGSTAELALLASPKHLCPRGKQPSISPPPHQLGTLHKLTRLLIPLFLVSFLLWTRAK